MDRFDHEEHEAQLHEQLQLMQNEELLTLWERSQQMALMLQAVFMKDITVSSNTEAAIIGELMRRSFLGAKAGGLPDADRRRPGARRHS